MLPKSWFTTGLNQLKATPEDSLSPTSALQLEPASTITTFTPSLPSLTPPSHDEQLQLPLSREMALYVTQVVEQITRCLQDTIGGSTRFSRHTTSYRS
jgi:hypothetical protein